MLADLTAKLEAKQDLDPGEIAMACSRLLDETAGLPERADFLRALHRKGETPAEIAGFVREFLTHAVRPKLTGEFLDVCGTGGDRAGLFNVSTAVMFVVAACGVPVVKHGNRGVTSKSGGADVLEALGVRLDLDPTESLEAAGCAFLFAQRYHPAFKAVAPVRKVLGEEGTPTIFNMIGPLLNPAIPAFQIAGVFCETLLPTYAEVFRLLGRKRAWVVHGTGGLDEVSTLGLTRGLSVEDVRIEPVVIDPVVLGFPMASLTDLRGGDPRENARLMENLLSGREKGAKRDILALNAACALVVAGAEADLPAALSRAEAALADGAPAGVLERLQRLG